jgi:phosphoglycerate dehydrogenase-like enzyme
MEGIRQQKQEEMDKPNIVVTFHPVQGQQAFLTELLGKSTTLTFLTELDAGERVPALEEATILLSWNFPREIQPQDYPHLRRVLFIQVLSAGADHMPFADLSPRIIVAGNPGAYAVPMAEHVMAMTLAQAKHLLVQQQKLKEGQFDQFTPNRLLSGMTAGILGYGGIGRATARLMRAFGMRIDAWWTEPFLAWQFRMEYPFLELPNVLGSPHNSGVVPGVLIGATRQAAENVKRFLTGEQVVGLVRRKDYL